MVLADAANGHAVLPAFILGLVMSRHYQQHREEQKRTRVVAFAFLTPFFFIKGGMNVSLGAVVANLGLLAALIAAKMIPKAAFIYPLARRRGGCACSLALVFYCLASSRRLLATLTRTPRSELPRGAGRSVVRARRRGGTSVRRSLLGRRRRGRRR